MGLFGAHFRFGSQLAFAQASDSLLDVVTAGMLLYTVRLAAAPEDRDHPFGHGRAEPLGGLVVAVLAGVMALEIVQNAATQWLTGGQADLDQRLLWFFVGKAAFKSVVFAVARLSPAYPRSPALDALTMDARNDVLASLLATSGVVGAQLGSPRIDTWLAFPMAAWILWTGVQLARENVRLLMGEAPPPLRQVELLALARGIEGVEDVHDLKAHFLGTALQVKVHVIVLPDISVKQAHDIGERVRLRLEEESDVSHALVHIDIE
jgi:cation diffusion facilitator family transporter